MLNVSNNFKSLILAPSREISGKITINGTTYYDNNYLQSIDIERGIQNDNKLIGNFISQKITVNIIDKTKAFNFSAGQLINYYFGVDNEFIQSCNLYVDKPNYDTVNKLWTITAYDKAVNFNDKISKLTFTYPITVRNYLTAICSYVGIPLSSKSFLNESVLITEAPNLSGDETLRYVVSRIAEYAFGNAVINNSNELEIRSITGNSVYTLLPDNYFDFKPNEQWGPVNQLVLSRQPQNDNVYAVTQGQTEILIANNPFIDYGATDKRASVISSLYAQISGYTVVPFTMQWQCALFLEIGDIITITDVLGNTYKSIYANERINYDGGMLADVSLSQPNTTPSVNNNVGPLVERIRQTEIRVNKNIGEISMVVEAVATAQATADNAATYSDNDIQSGSYLYSDKSDDSVVDLTIEGRTLKNEIAYDPTTWVEWATGSQITKDATGMKFTSNGSSWAIANYYTTFKPKTKFGFLYNVVESTIVNNLIVSDCAFPTTILDKTIGMQKKILTSYTNISLMSFKLQISSASEPSGNYIKIDKCRLYELPAGSQIEADFNNLTAVELNVKYPFYQGTLGNVGDTAFNVVSKSKNLLTNTDFLTDTTGWAMTAGAVTRDTTKTYNGSNTLKYVKTDSGATVSISRGTNYIPIISNTVYTASVMLWVDTSTYVGKRIYFECKNLKADNTTSASNAYKSIYYTVQSGDIGKWVKVSLTFTSCADAAKVSFYVAIQTTETPACTMWLAQPQLEQGSATDYESPKINEINVSSVLRSVPTGVCDTKNTLTGNVTRKIGTVVYDGSPDEDWKQMAVDSNFIRFRILDDSVSYGYENLVCDRFPTVKVGDTSMLYENAHTNGTDRRIGVTISVSKLTTQDVAGFKLWLSTHPITVYYELATPVTEIGDTQLLATYYNITNISSDALIQPNMIGIFKSKLWYTNHKTELAQNTADDATQTAKTAQDNADSANSAISDLTGDNSPFLSKENFEAYKSELKQTFEGFVLSVDYIDKTNKLQGNIDDVNNNIVDGVGVVKTTAVSVDAIGLTVGNSANPLSTVITPSDVNIVRDGKAMITVGEVTTLSKTVINDDLTVGTLKIIKRDSGADFVIV